MSGRHWLVPWWQVRKRIKALLMERRTIAMGKDIAKRMRAGERIQHWNSEGIERK